MKIWAGLVLGLGLLGCGDPYWRSEEFSDYYHQPSEESRKRNLERQEIWYWTTNPAKKKRIGYLELWEVTLRGSREPYEYYQILNATGTEPIGLIDRVGRFYKFDENAQRQFIGEWAVIDVGLKIFFNVGLSANLGFEDIDPYRD